ncbi:protease HtpX [Ornithinibacillus halophilus]|uniref:Heat shock protein. Metallo peptidase. MEROPS family M48B n=1 Tax=Ornithinibacillus halophilus TaxID=930117 RepID=A0A1M5P304_9BACI|nr:protease HtpX [Ornithinibacillus halophilus]SHG96206.1 Heat shock protein. Metallo peptidase. MEROPS family M48B [Ornithinibacillus halophilus]
MALLSCFECGNQVSDQAAACPHCGAPFQEQAATATEVGPMRDFGGITSFIKGSEAIRVKGGTMKRWTWFILANVAIVASLSIISGGALIAIAPFFLLFGFTFPFIGLLFSKTFAKKAHHMHIINPEGFQNEEEKSLYEMVASLCSKAGMQHMPEVGIYESRDVNAFATGPSKKRSLVAFSTALLEQMDEEAIAAVAAHEVAHISNGDMVTLSLVQSVVNTIVLLITLPLNMIKWVAFFSENVSALMFYLIAFVKFVATLVLAFLGSLVVKAFSRKREFAADKLASELINKESMIFALESLKMDNPVVVKEQKAYAALKISSPSRVWDIFSTHPSLERRIERLKNL